MQSECSKFGCVKKILIFDVCSRRGFFFSANNNYLIFFQQRHPEGVVSVKFEHEPSALACLEVWVGVLIN
jgi:hypothetical protein